MEATPAVDARGASGRPGRIVARALGNVLLGVALGIACYYLTTDLAAQLRQRELREEVSGLGVLSSADPSGALAEPSALLDFEGWEELDVAYWNGLPEGGVLGRLVVESMGLDTLVVKGHSRAVLKKGPGWIDYTDLPGPTGNTGISGHRTTYGAPFSDIDLLEAGDRIAVETVLGIHLYEVVSTAVVEPDALWVTEQWDGAWLTLTTCHPEYRSIERFVVFAKLIDGPNYEAISAAGEVSYDPPAPPAG